MLIYQNEHSLWFLQWRCDKDIVPLAIVPHTRYRMIEMVLYPTPRLSIIETRVKYVRETTSSTCPIAT